MPQGIEIPRFEKYNGKGDPISDVDAFVALCSDFILHKILLAKIFPRNFREVSLEWFSSLLNHSMHSFKELVEEFINHFQVHMTPKMILTNLMRCRQHEHEKVIDFISWYQLIYSQINVKVIDPNLQKMFIENFQTKVQDKLKMMKFPTFLHLCTALCDYQNPVSSHEKNLHLADMRSLRQQIKVTISLLEEQIRVSFK
jgi:hypothetical protein